MPNGSKEAIAGQRARRKVRVLAEKRYECKLCNKVFSSAAGLKTHIDNQVCKKPVKEYKHPIIQCQCGGKYLDIPSVKSRHIKTKKHLSNT